MKNTKLLRHGIRKYFSYWGHTYTVLNYLQWYLNVHIQINGDRLLLVIKLFDLKEDYVTLVLWFA